MIFRWIYVTAKREVLYNKYVENTALLSDSLGSLQRSLSKVSKVGNRHGLRMNAKSIQFLTLNTKKAAQEMQFVF